ncbi:hypothetical protein IWX49DRAFT_593668 [Phyllosticta citricarpa]
MSAPLPTEYLRPLQTCISLDPEKTPREIRDMIYDLIIEYEYCNGRFWTHPDFEPWSVSIWSAFEHRCPYEREAFECLPPLATACKQVQEEFIDRVCRTATFEIYMIACEDQPIKPFTAPIARINFGEVRHLDLWLNVTQLSSCRFASKPRETLNEPFSVRYVESGGQLSAAKLVRSDTSLAPTPYYDLKKYGFYSDHQLPELLEAEYHHHLPTAQDGGFGEQLKQFLSYLGSRGNLRIFRVSILIRGGAWQCPHVEQNSGISEFLRLFYSLHRLEKATIQFYVYECCRGSHEPTMDLFNERAKEAETWLTSRNEGCNRGPDMVCNCEACFPPLGIGQTGHNDAQTDFDDEASSVDLWGRINEIDMETERFQAAEENSNETEDPALSMYDDRAFLYEGIYIGLEDTPHRKQYKEVFEEFRDIWFLGIPSLIPYIEFIKIKHLIFHLEPYSLKYNATGSLQAATLHRSESSQSPTPYFDVKKYGCANDHALSQLIQARKENMLPTRHNSKFGRALHKLLVIEPKSEAQFSEEEIHRATACVEWAKQECTGRGDSVLPDPSDFTVGYEEDTLARYSRFCVGVNEHIEGDFGCGCPKCSIDRDQCESLSPTAFWDVKKYGIHGISQLPHFRKARRVASLRNQFNSDLGKAVADLFIELGRRKQTRKLKLRFGFELPDTCDLGQWNCIHTGSGLSELMRPMARLHGLKDFNVRIEFREGWGNGPGCGCEPARMILEGVVRKLKSQVGLYRAGCNRNLDITCDCLNCFPALEGHRNRCFDENGGPQVEEEFDKQAIQLDIDKVELETHHIEKAMERNF